ncbi:MAG TPA: hypothetical protein VMW52_10495 [Phycisphaerae bacterium]|nr:hypothetical protein [Phycisphaerae bacterium]
MAEGATESRSRDGWARTSALLALTFNINRDPKKQRAVSPDAFNPWAEKGKAKAPQQRVPLTVLRDVFVRPDGKPNGGKRRGSRRKRT